MISRDGWIRTGLALAILGGAAWAAQGPARGTAGDPFCSGDGGLGVACPGMNMGDRGHGCANSYTPGGLLHAKGEALLSADSMQLMVEGLPPGVPLMYLQSTDELRRGTGVVFGDGILCLAGTFERLGVGRSSRFGTYTMPDGRHGLGVLGAIPRNGGVRYYQVWYRDPGRFATPDSWNLTNGWATTWAP